MVQHAQDRSRACQGCFQQAENFRAQDAVECSSGQPKRGNTVAEAKLRPGRKKCFWTISKAFLAFKTQILCPQLMSREDANEESFGKH